MKNTRFIVQFILVAGLMAMTACDPAATNKRNSSSKKNKELSVAFYNVENLFDTIDDPTINDQEFLPASKKQWTSDRYSKKLQSLSKVLKTLDNNEYPDLIGLCEVENEAVVKDLVTEMGVNNYRVIHFDSPDIRGIDNALIMNATIGEVLKVSKITVSIDSLSRFKTRDILHAVIKLQNNDTLNIFVNHFPSRSGGQAKSEFKRVYVASVLRHNVDSILAVDADANILIMGDMNDEPFDKSIAETLKAHKTYSHSADSLYNLMYAMVGEKGSYYYRDNWNVLDQFIISHGLADTTSDTYYITNSTTIPSYSWLFQDSTAGKYEGYPYRTYAGHEYLGGYSDHLPIFMKIQVK